MTVAEQVISVFTGVRGYLDDVELSEIKKFETEIIEKVKNEKNNIIDTVQLSGKLDKENEDSLIQTIEEYKKNKK